MGIYSRHATTVLILLLTFVTASHAQAAKLHPVPGIARALAAGPSGVMPSGLTVQRSQQLGVMLLKSQVNLSLGGGAVVPVTRGASLSVGGLARGAITVIKNSSPPKLIGSALIAGAIASLPGAEVINGAPHRTPGFVRTGERWSANPNNAPGGYVVTYHATPQLACDVVLGTPAQAWHWQPLYSVSGTDRYSCYRKYSASYCPSCGNEYRGWAKKETIDCPNGFDTATLACRPTPLAPLPFTDSDWDDLEGVIPSSDPSPADVQDFWFNLCGGIGSCMGSYTNDPTLAGPPSVQGPQTTTTSTGPNGTTTTTTDTQHDLDYSNPDGVVVRDRTTTTKTDPDGTTTTDTTQDTGPVTPADPFVTPGSGVPPDPEFEGTFSDTPFPDIEPFYQQKYPDGLQGVWNTRKAEFEDSAFMEFLSSFIPSFSGSCPGWSMNVNIASWASFGVHEFQSLCWVFDFIKVVLLVSAAFLCRALIFGG